jgi:hypothetical protein
MSAIFMYSEDIYSLFIDHLLLIYLLFSTCSGSMQEAPCGSMMPAIMYDIFFIHLLHSTISLSYFVYQQLIIYLLVRACSGAACGRRPAAA